MNALSPCLYIIGRFSIIRRWQEIMVTIKKSQPDHMLNHLEASESRYRRLFETAKDGILILDGDTGRIIDANPFIQDMLGYAGNDLIGKALWEIGPVKNITASQEAMHQLQKTDYI